MTGIKWSMNIQSISSPLLLIMSIASCPFAAISHAMPLPISTIDSILELEGVSAMGKGGERERERLNVIGDSTIYR